MSDTRLAIGSVLALAPQVLDFYGFCGRTGGSAMSEESPAYGQAETAARSPSQRLLQFFQFAHLRPRLQGVARPFCALAFELEHLLPDGAEKTTALRKLLEAKDCAVRSVIERPDWPLAQRQAQTQPQTHPTPGGASLG